MIEVNVTVSYHGKDYVTNVLAARDADEEEILRSAEEQVEKQWGISEPSPSI
ncbi:BA3454 family stress response protein [Bacillus xiapuensis]|uniref:BA3454 family stress response protein n=1 Tax=Bacillus xiapuensis TaxID=2014075 RepID=UPI0012FDC7CF|nr:BA3454 family stress response protein [Bacillus xiapuensis]